MKGSPRFQALAVVVLGLVAASPRAGGQGFGLSVTGSADSISTNDSVVYTTTVTNLTGVLLSGVVVTNSFSPSIQILGATPAIFVSSTNNNTVVFTLGSLDIGQIQQMSVTVQPTLVGAITNLVTVMDIYTLYAATTSLVTQVTNTTVTLADLAVSIAGPPQAIITNDWMTYGITVSNLGPGTASGVFLTNSLRSDLGLKSVSPANLSPTVTSSNLLFSLGTLTNLEVWNLAITVQPTNAGPLVLSASVSASGSTDTNSANDTASTNLFVTNYLSGVLAVSSVSTQQFNQQNGLMEQTIVLSNAGASVVASTRLVVSGLTNLLSNAVGTNNGNPFVVHGAALNPGQTVSLLLQYFVPTHRAVPVSLQAFEVPPFNVSPPAVLGAPVSGLRLFSLASGGMLVRFPAFTNRSYTVVYNDNGDFSKSFAAQPVVISPANYVFWIDYGPPETLSSPTNGSTTSRAYRVYLNP